MPKTSEHIPDDASISEIVWLSDMFVDVIRQVFRMIGSKAVADGALDENVICGIMLAIKRYNASIERTNKTMFSNAEITQLIAVVNHIYDKHAPKHKDETLH